MNRLAAKIISLPGLGAARGFLLDYYLLLREREDVAQEKTAIDILP
jgi:hypothetical protein